MSNSITLLAKYDIVYNVTADVHGNEIAFPLDEPDACFNSGLDCPLKGNQTYKYTKTVPVRIYYPPVMLELFQFILFIYL